MPLLGGRVASNFVQASRPPADAPMPATAKPPRGSGGPRAPRAGGAACSPAALTLGGFLFGMVWNWPFRRRRQDHYSMFIRLLAINPHPVCVFAAMHMCAYAFVDHE